MVDEKKDFKEVKVKVAGGAKEFTETLSRSMLYSGVNIFGQLTALYMNSKEDFLNVTSSANAPNPSDGGLGGASGSSMMSLGTQVLSIFKKLQKKDAVTKVKAFAELEAYLETIDVDSEELQNVLTFFLYHMCRILLNESDKKVREATHMTFAAFIKKCKRKLGPHLKKIFPLWFSSFFDPSPEVAKLARKNFDTAFPEDKQSQVFKLAYKTFLHFANEQLLQSENTNEKEVGAQSKDTQEDVFDRITSCVLQALANSFFFIQTWTTEEQNAYKFKLLETLDLQADESTLIQKKQKTLVKSYLWAFLNEKYRGKVRAACLQFVTAFITHMPVEEVRKHIPAISPLVYNLVGDKNSMVQTIFWREALFQLGKNFPESWTFVSIKKDFLPKLHKCLKEAAYGAPAALYESLVKFFSVCPLFHLVDPGNTFNQDKLNKASFKDRCNILKDTMAMVYTGLLHNEEAVAFHSDLIAAFFETLTFVLLKRVQPVLTSIESGSSTQEDLQFVLKQVERMLSTPIKDFCSNYSKVKSAIGTSRNIRSTIPKRFAQMLVDLSKREFNLQLYTSLCEQFVQCLPNDNRNSSRLLAYVIKPLAEENCMPQAYKQVVFQSVLFGWMIELGSDIDNLAPDVSKTTMVILVSKVQNYCRVVYTLNKRGVTAEGFRASEAEPFMPIEAGSMLRTVCKKESLAAKMLSKDDLSNFFQIKLSLVKTIVLLINGGYLAETDEIYSNLNDCLVACQTDTKLLELEQAVILPQWRTFSKKLKLNHYFDVIRSLDNLHDLLFGAISVKMLSQLWITEYSELLKAMFKSNSILKASDCLAIKQHVLQIVRSQKLSFGAMCAFYEAIETMVITEEEETSAELRTQLLELLLCQQVQRGSDQEHFNTMWRIFSEAAVGKPAFVQQCTLRLQERLAQLIHQQTTSIKSVSDFSHMTDITARFTEMPAIIDKAQTAQTIVLQKNNFECLEKNCLPLKLFRDLFLVGGSLNTLELVSTKQDGEYQFVWLIASLLNFKHLKSLSSLLELKKQLIIFVETEVIPALVVKCQQGEPELLIQVAQECAKRAQTERSYLYTFEFLLGKMVDPGEDYPSDEKPILKVDEFKKIYKAIAEPVVSKFVASNFTEGSNDLDAELVVKLFENICYYILDEPSIAQVFKTTKNNISSALTSQTQLADLPLVKVQLQLYMTLAPILDTTTDSAVFQVSLLNTMLSQLLLVEPKTQEDARQKSNLQNLAIELCGALLEKCDKSVFDKTKTKNQIEKLDLHSTIMDVLERTAEELDQLDSNQVLDCTAVIWLCKVIRKTLDWTPTGAAIVSMFISAVKDRANWFDQKLASQVQDLPSSIQQFEHEMLQEMGETLLVCSGHLTEEILQAQVENNLYFLFKCSVDSLQKAAFVLLKYIYQNFIPPVEFQVDETDEIAKMKQHNFEEDKEDLDHKHQARLAREVAFKNLAPMLIEAIDEAPSEDLKENADEGVQTASSQLEQLVFGKNQSGCMSSKMFGYLLAWNAALHKIEQGRIKAQFTQNNQYAQVLAALTEYLEDEAAIYQQLLVSIIPYLPRLHKSAHDQLHKELIAFEPEYFDIASARDSRLMCLHTLTNFMKAFPSLGRKFYQDCDKKFLEVTLPYIKSVVSPAILDNEIRKLEMSQIELGKDLKFDLFKSTMEVVVTYQKTDEIRVQMKLKIPQDYPLKSVNVDIGDQLKVESKLVRKWTLSIRMLLQNRNGDILTGILFWKQNIDRETEGLSECYICYSIVHNTDKSLPSMGCRTCKNKFHVACIRKWFSTSGKSNCPMCQQHFFQ